MPKYGLKKSYLPLCKYVIVFVHLKEYICCHAHCARNC